MSPAGSHDGLVSMDQLVLNLALAYGVLHVGLASTSASARFLTPLVQ